MIVTGSVTRTVYVNDNFSIRNFMSKDFVELPNGRTTKSFKVKGEFIPSSWLDIQLEGEFDAKPYIGKDGSKTFTFNVKSCEELKIAERFSIIKYLSTIKGIGTVLATRIYQQFGDDTFKVLDDNIEVLRGIKGISGKKYEVIAADYLSRGAAKKLYIYMVPFKVPNSKIERIYRKYRESSVDMVSHHPFTLYLQSMLSFDAASKIARANELDSLSAERIQASVVEALKRAENKGHVFLPWGNLLEESAKILEVNVNSSYTKRKIANMIHENARLLVGSYISNDTIEGKTMIYKLAAYTAETEAAYNIKRLASETTNIDYMSDILNAEKELGITLSDEQRSAVQTAMNTSLSIVTGGPGTGKTSFQKVLYNVFRKHSNKRIALAAPTGRAATRMTQSSGLPAQTIHQMLHIMVSDEDVISNPKPVDAGLVVVDEMSMIDIFVANSLFSAIQPGTKVVCVGDAFQLPSVGCGEVLQDMIRSKVVPVTLFTKVFRQQDGSIIAANAAEINHGGTELEYGEAFEFIEKTKSDDILEVALEEYKKALDEYGPDETTILTPYRKSTVTGVNELNPRLKELCNPLPEKKTRTNKVESTKFDIYLGDKVMFTKNTCVDNVLLSNGDIGYVTNIRLVDNVQNVVVDFKDGRVVTMIGDDVKHLVPAYCTTVHKSQGSEYKCCIIIIDPKHSILLKRNLVYTAITRAKEKVILIGDKETFFDAVVNQIDTGTRFTGLKSRLEA